MTLSSHLVIVQSHCSVSLGGQRREVYASDDLSTVYKIDTTDMSAEDRLSRSGETRSITAGENGYVYQCRT